MGKCLPRSQAPTEPPFSEELAEAADLVRLS
jgi:hypothetical protein